MQLRCKVLIRREFLRISFFRVKFFIVIEKILGNKYVDCNNCNMELGAKSNLAWIKFYLQIHLGKDFHLNQSHEFQNELECTVAET